MIAPSAGYLSSVMCACLGRLGIEAPKPGANHQQVARSVAATVEQVGNPMPTHTMKIWLDEGKEQTHDPHC